MMNGIKKLLDIELLLLRGVFSIISGLIEYLFEWTWGKKGQNMIFSIIETLLLLLHSTKFSPFLLYYECCHVFFPFESNLYLFSRF